MLCANVCLFMRWYSNVISTHITFLFQQILDLTVLLLLTTDYITRRPIILDTALTEQQLKSGIKLWVEPDVFIQNFEN